MCLLTLSDAFGRCFTFVFSSIYFACMHWAALTAWLCGSDKLLFVLAVHPFVCVCMRRLHFTHQFSQDDRHLFSETEQPQRPECRVSQCVCERYVGQRCRKGTHAQHERLKNGFHNVLRLTVDKQCQFNWFCSRFALSLSHAHSHKQEQTFEQLAINNTPNMNYCVSWAGKGA